ncbi:response regulator [Exiguobacterium sp. RIT452]|jgi:two-component system response regulator (stage 0 sporulation protein F)|uniref:Histidine kinase n=1 Tax=Exiguobacterium undae TaxID=169177 RepID=A0ABX2V585_9BACL|nr:MULTISPECIES: response regulator [Exiguobacterium]OAN10233.1 histidine kinase [Exiguobacterium undae]OIN65987.1 response regulator [Exiguobacterium sp. KRL4]RJO95836.1 response regulator [Exiguobacterium sp. RIT452]
MKGRLLIAEDEPGIRNLLAQLFRAQGYTTDVAVDGLETIERLKEADYDLLLMDVNMPGRTGLEVLRHQDEVGRRVRTILMTALGEKEAMEEAKRLGVVAFFGKPFDIFELKKEVTVQISSDVSG